ncbi:uncharacterized protein FA14DRAFT_43002 [Meira miltonrushii]|uniref:DUF431-domain-containing protein n=1 Tax=Meira miltonrushii TaxID=1280837 RepID=A0A316VDV5_9BASI|nr:uncharacterized protein FA14DRAFT_43002 [Meira miltonrushii]PWN35504.1 hypothetical protein FA14DRAFT_43002 [Meira miltonrushii]
MSQRPQYIIEHMEDLDADPDSPATFPKWALLEYRHMLTLVGPGSTVHFTGLVSNASRDALHKALSASSSSQPSAEFEVHVEGILDMAKKRNAELSQICLLDPKSPIAVSVHDAGLHSGKATTAKPSDGPFRYFLFGGILGDDPPRDRTGALRALGFPTRHLGPVQMTTDTALGVTKRVVEDGIAINLPKEDVGSENTEKQGPGGSMAWITHPELKFGAGESVTMPFRYMVADNNAPITPQTRPLMPPGMREHIRQDLDRAFEF